MASHLIVNRTIRITDKFSWFSLFLLLVYIGANFAQPYLFYLNADITGTLQFRKGLGYIVYTHKAPSRVKNSLINS